MYKFNKIMGLLEGMVLEGKLFFLRVFGYGYVDNDRRTLVRRIFDISQQSVPSQQ
jgi:hypothetical protein